MDLRFLDSFVVIVDCGSVAEAARRLNLTPAALAQRIQRLEEDLGQPLLVRSGRTVRPTPGGIAMLDAARELVAAARDLRAIAANGAPAGRLRLGATASAMTGLLPAIIADLARRHPQVEYFVQPGSSVDLYHRVVAGDLDAALIVRPPFALPKTTAWTTLRHESLILIAPADCAGDDPLALLRQLPFIRYDRNQWGGQIVDRYLRDRGTKLREFLELDALDAIAALVDRGLGVAIVPDWSPPWPEGLRLRKLPLAGAEARQSGVLWNRSGARAAAVLAFVDASAGLAGAGDPRD